jgi:hypothetical protein
VNELLLGQVTLVFAALLWLVARRPDSVATGVPLGIALALAPKPLLAPVLLWMLVRRRRALLGTLMAGAATTLAGLLLMGTDLHRQWLEVLVHTGTVLRRGNVSVWSGGTDPFTIALALVVVGVTAALILRDEAAGFVAALFAGLLLAPYTLLYAASILLVAVRPALSVSPLGTRLLAITGNPGVLAAFVLWCMAGITAALWGEHRVARTPPVPVGDR